LNDQATATQLRAPAWTADEDAKFVAILEREVIGNGKKLEEVYPIVAEELSRPEGGCKYRYTSAIRKSLTGKLKETLVDNSKMANRQAPSTSPRVAGANSRTNLITRIQQVDKELVKVDKDIAEMEKRLSDLKQKKATLGEDMVRYTDLLVKSAKGESESA
jgi:hypothetical protein